MQVIIDYNNILPQMRNRGLKYIAESVARTLGATAIAKYKRLHLRLYDGWYIIQTPTQLAQTTSAEIQRDFPIVVTIPSNSGPPVKAVIVAEMAYSLHCDPNIHIWHTYRPRSGQSNVTCKAPTSVGCVSTSCVLSALPRFFSNHQCPDTNCSITTEDLIFRNEQKLVDSMMSTDLMSFHLSSQEELVVVSSDDDLWPAIRLLLNRGHTVYHIHTRSTHTTPSFYTRRVSSSQYIQLHF